jgi:hypothetical protein
MVDDEKLSDDEVPMVSLEDGEDTDEEEDEILHHVPVAGTSIKTAPDLEPAPKVPVESIPTPAPAPSRMSPVEHIPRDRSGSGSGPSARKHRPRLKSLGILGINNTAGRISNSGEISMKQAGMRRLMAGNRPQQWSRYSGPGSPQFFGDGGMMTAPAQMMGMPLDENGNIIDDGSGMPDDFSPRGSGQKKKKEKGKKTEKQSLGQKIQNSSLAIYIAIILFGYFVAQQGEVLEAHLGQVITVVFNVFSGACIVASVIAGLIVLYRALSGAGIFKKNKKEDEIEMERIPDGVSFGRHQFPEEMRMQSPLDGYWPEDVPMRTRNEYGGPHLFGQSWHEGGTVGLSRRNSHRTQSAQRSYSQPAIHSPKPMYGYDQRGMSSQNVYGPDQRWDQRQHHYRTPHGPKIPIVSGGYEGPLPQQSGTGYDLFPDPYASYDPAWGANSGPQPVKASVRVNIESTKDKKDSFTSPVKVVFRRKESSEAGKLALDDTSPPYVDDFSCKPYGAPPRRFRGIVN